MENKLAITIVALMVAALAAPAVMADSVNYDATVLTGQDTSVTTGFGEFGNILAGTDGIIATSLVLTNDGDWEATVTASSIGLADVAEIGPTLTDLVLTKDSIDYSVVFGPTALDNIAPLGGSATYGATLAVPLGQTAGTYSGTVDLVFGNAP